MDARSLSRRGLFSRVAQTTTPASAPPTVPAAPPSRAAGAGSGKTPRAELVNVLEYEGEARRSLAPAVFAAIAGSERTAIDRITILPRVNVPTTNLDLTCQLFGASHFAPILVAPLAHQERFHAEGELATARGASAARATLVASGRSATPIGAIVAAASVPPWFQVLDSDANAASQASAAVGAGCPVVVVSAGMRISARGEITRAAANWTAIAQLARTLKAPVVVKGIRSPEEAETAITNGAAGVIFSLYPLPLAAVRAPGSQPGLLGIGPVVERVRGRVPVLADGDFRRGTDILKALALGAKAVLVGRPVLWGLASYGSEGVQGVLAMLQTELARYMAMSGRVNLESVDRTLIRIHSR